MLLKKTFILALSYTAILPAALQADIELARLFSDHMVLQREKPVEVWGWADAGAPVEVCVQEHCTGGTADDSGAWTVTLSARSASGPHELSARSGETEIVVSDVYFGDVWLAGGQSNMEWKLNMGIDNVEAEYADSDYPMIRFFEVENRLSFREEERLAMGQWKPASRRSVEAFSAVAWLFAKRNHLEKGVAVGVIDNNWGGTPAQAWVSRARVGQLPAYREQTLELYADPEAAERLFVENERNKAEKYGRLRSEEDARATGAHLADYDDSQWARTDFPTDVMFEHLVWFRRTFDLAEVPEKGVILDLGDLVQDAFVFVNGELIATENWTFSGSRHELPATLLRQGKNQVSVRLGNSWDNRPKMGGQGDLHLVTPAGSTSLNDNWAWSNTVEPPLPIERRFSHEPAALYNAMIHPVRRYGMRGVIWYQGESNVGTAPYYGDLFRVLIEDWRHASGQSLPFLFVQLAGFNPYRFPEPESMFAELRYQQSLALELPLTGMATAFDIGEELDIHPRNKQDVAKRLWLQAQKVAFGEDIAADAPAPLSHQVSNGRMILTFDAPAGELEIRGGGDQVEAFILAGTDGVFHAAQARLDGNTVTVWSDKVKNPVALRYAWSDFPRVNLYSTGGLPVLPFRMDPPWQFNAGGRVAGNAAIQDGRVYITGGTRLHALDRSGELLWSYDAGAPSFSEVTFGEGAIFMLADNGLHALDIAGKRLWFFKTADAPLAVEGQTWGWGPGDFEDPWAWYRSAPRVAPGKVFFSNALGTWAVDAATGKRLWHAQTGVTHTRPVYHDGTVVAGSWDNHLYGLNADNGSINWKIESRLPQGDMAGWQGWEGFNLDPVLHNGTVYAGNRGTHFYAIHADSGVEKWSAKHATSWVGSPAVFSDGVLYYGMSDGYTLVGLQAGSGNQVLMFRNGFYNFARPQAYDTHVFMASVSGQLFAIDKATGQGRVIFQTPDSKKNLTELQNPDGGLKFHYAAQGGYTHENATRDVQRMLMKLDSLLSLTLEGNMLYAGSAGGNLYAIPISAE